MKGDFTRSTFRKDKHYNKVKMQQGRVQIDADFNEQIDILGHYSKTTLRDIIGESGAPSENAGFEIMPFLDNDTGEVGYHIGNGRYYVDGILVENEGIKIIENGIDKFNLFNAKNQYDLPLLNDGTSPALPTEIGALYIAYIDV